MLSVMAASFDIEVNVSTENGTVLKTGLMYKQGKHANRADRYLESITSS